MLVAIFRMLQAEQKQLKEDNFDGHYLTKIWSGDIVGKR